MTVDFCGHFWGEKNNGFDVLYHNMKYGLVSSKELLEFFRERLSIEESQSKLLAKLAKQASNNCANGSFAPLWQALKTSSEKQSSVHSQMVQKFQELIKEVVTYNEQQNKKHKVVKEEQSGTLEAVQSIQSTSITLTKSRDIYHQRCLECEKLKRLKASPGLIEKAEVKMNKSRDDYQNLVDKFGTSRDNFERRMMLACKHFQDVEEGHLRQMKVYLCKYGDVLQTGHELVAQLHAEYGHQCVDATVDRLLEQFVTNKATGSEIPGRRQFEEPDLSGLDPAPSPEAGEITGAQQTAATATTTTNGDKNANKKEGQSREHDQPVSSVPGARFPEPEGHLAVNGDPATVAANSATNGGQHDDPAFGRNAFRGSKSAPVEALRHLNWTTGLWKSKNREGKKEKKGKKKKGDNNKEEKNDVDDKVQKDEMITISNLDIPEVDEEGYSVRPDLHQKENNDKGSFYSSSDSDSEEEREKRIRIEIKPLTNGSAPLSASIDELRASVGGLALSPIGQISNRKSPNGELDAHVKRPVAASQFRPAADLMNLGSLSSPPTSSASTPTGGYGFLPSPPGVGMQSPSTSSGPRSSETTPTPTRSDEIGDLFSELGDLPPALPPKHSQQQQSSGSRGSTPVGPPLLPRPPSRRALEGPAVTNRGRMSPVSQSMNRTDSIGSLSSEFRASSMSVGSSRGPSPLTIGMSDIIPIAVAFQEIAHAYFKGTDESRCMVKLTGDMMLSFPAGIVQVLTNNPSPASLLFRVRNVSKLESVHPNKQLVTQDEAQSTADCYIYEFNMPGLTTVLRRQQEQNPSASYFNVDILKYQVKCGPGAQGVPLHMVAHWKCDSDFTDFRLDYKYNGAALTTPSPLLNITIFVPVEGGVTSMQSKPNGQWIAEGHRAIWRFTELSQHSDDDGSGSLRARFDLSNGPGQPGTIAAQFSCEGTTLSGADFELMGLGYRVSLIKRRVITGKYICETEPDMRFRYAPPPV